MTNNRDHYETSTYSNSQPEPNLFSKCTFSWAYHYIHQFYHRKSSAFPKLVPEQYFGPEINVNNLKKLLKNDIVKKREEQPNLNINLFKIMLKLVKKEFILQLFCCMIWSVCVIFSSALFFSTFMDYAGIGEDYDLSYPDNSFQRTFLASYSDNQTIGRGQPAILFLVTNRKIFKKLFWLPGDRIVSFLAKQELPAFVMP